MSKNSRKNYLDVSKQVRNVLEANVPVDIDKIQSQIIETHNIKTNKEAIAISAFWLAAARTHGEDIDKTYIENLLNKLKGKNNSSALEIRKTLNDAINMISNRKIKGILSTMDQKKMATAIAETVLQKVGSKDTVKQITKQDEDNGWTKFGIALIIVIAAKFLTRR